jgi:hypothetical protein
MPSLARRAVHFGEGVHGGHVEVIDGSAVDDDAAGPGCGLGDRSGDLVVESGGVGEVERSREAQPPGRPGRAPADVWR